MIFNALVAAVTTQNSTDKTSNSRIARRRYVTEKYHERSIANRYFK